MDSHRQVTQQHYDLHAQQQQQKTTAQVLRERQEGPAAPLKKFHNEIKRRLIYRFGYQAEALIDYACGRGGDIQKWDAAKIGYVLGLDISGAEIQEAQRRFGELKAKRGSGSRLQAEFQHIDSLAAEHFEAPRHFDVATCMFAMHYFFDKQEALKTLLGSIAANLKQGGFFIGCVPDGKRVKAHLKKSNGLLEQPHLRLKAVSQTFDAFGGTYVMEIPDTVVEGHQGFTEGSEEYLVFEKVLLAEAAKAGLHPVLEYGDATVDVLFEQADAQKAMKHFAPKYPEGSDASLSTASEIYMAFVFQKVAKAEEVQAPPVPPPDRKEAGAGFRAGGGGGAGGGQQRQQGGRGGGNDKMSSLTWQLPYAANYLPANHMPIVYHNVRPGGLQQRSEQGRWIIWPPPMPAFPGPVQYTEDGREVLQRLPNGYPIHEYGQELDYWRQQQEQQHHGMFMPPPQQPPPQQQHQQQHGHGGAGQAPNGMQQQGHAQYPQSPAAPPGGPAAGGGGRGARGGRGSGRKGAGTAAAAAAAGDGDDAAQVGGRGRGRGGGRGSRGGRTAGSKRDRPAEGESAGQDPAGGEGDAAVDGQQTPAAKKQAVEAAETPAAAPNGSNAAAAAAAGDDEAAADGAAAGSLGAPAAAPAVAAAPPVSRVPQSADAKLARVKAADPLEYKERQEPAPLSPAFVEAMIQQAPPYADS